MGFDSDLVTGFAQLLEDRGVGTWKAPPTPYLAGDPNPIILGTVPASPDSIIVLTNYGVDDDPTLSDGIEGLQVRTRGSKDLRVVLDLDAAVFNALQGLPATVLSTGIRTQLTWRRSSTYLGVDGGGRHERSSNYYVRVHRPSPNRT